MYTKKYGKFLVITNDATPIRSPTHVILIYQKASWFVNIGTCNFTVVIVIFAISAILIQPAYILNVVFVKTLRFGKKNAIQIKEINSKIMTTVDKTI